MTNLVDACRLVEETRCDGAMLGRAIFGNPWLFTNKEAVRGLEDNTPDTENNEATDSINLEISREEKIKVLLEHVKLYNELFLNTKPFDVMKRHFKAYIHGFEGAAELRTELYECKTAEEVEAVIKNHTK